MALALHRSALASALDLGATAEEINHPRPSDSQTELGMRLSLAASTRVYDQTCVNLRCLYVGWLRQRDGGGGGEVDVALAFGGVERKSALEWYGCM